MRASNLVFWRHFQARPRLVVCVCVGFVVALVLPNWLALHAATRMIVGWNATTCLYLILGSIMMLRSSHEQIQRRAQLQDEGKMLILSLVGQTTAILCISRLSLALRAKQPMLQ